jgi:hypothetical protein
MRVHRIAYFDEVYYVDLDHILMLTPPTESFDGRQYGFHIWLAFRDKAIFIGNSFYIYTTDVKKKHIDPEFSKLYLAWSGKEYEQDTASA